MTVPRLRVLLLACVIVAAAAPAAAADGVLLSGSVIDVGADSGAPSGIPGVAITVRSAALRTLATGLTDAGGRYEIQVKRASPPYVLVFEKLGYQLRPTQHRIAKAGDALKPVEMIREAAPAAYYRAVAARAAELKLTAAERQQRVAMVVELPPANKSVVVEEMKRLAAVPALEQIQVAEKSKAIETNVRSKLLADSELASLKVNADASSGVVQLSGVVETSEQKSRATDLAQSVSGVSRVLNMLSIQTFRGATGSAATGAAKARQ